jgi:hypothetical protein
MTEALLCLESKAIAHYMAWKTIKQLSSPNGALVFRDFGPARNLSRLLSEKCLSASEAGVHRHHFNHNLTYLRTFVADVELALSCDKN